VIAEMQVAAELSSKCYAILKWLAYLLSIFTMLSITKQHFLAILSIVYVATKYACVHQVHLRYA